MKRSTERILTTHVGSLPRPPDLQERLQLKDRGEPYDAAAFESRVRQAVGEVVRKQIEAGLDIVADGELSKSNFTNYVKDRLSGLDALNRDPYPGPPPMFPEIRRVAAQPPPAGHTGCRRPGCAPAEYAGVGLEEFLGSGA